MCLSNLREYSGSPVRLAWKVVEERETGLCYPAYSIGKKALHYRPFSKVMIEPIQYCDSPGFSHYPKGFHCFLSHRGALAEVLDWRCRPKKLLCVRISDIRGIGYQFIYNRKYLCAIAGKLEFLGGTWNETRQNS